MRRFGFVGTSGLLIAGMTWTLVVMTGACQQILGIPDELPIGQGGALAGGMGGSGTESTSSSTSTSGTAGMSNGGMGGMGSGSTGSTSSSGMGASSSSGMGSSSSSSSSSGGPICTACEWSRALSGANNQVVTDVAVDGLGNVVFVGSITGDANLGADCPGGPCPLTAITATKKDIFVAKVDQNGAPLWTKVVGDTADLQEATAVAIDSSGNIVVAGQFQGNIDFGMQPLVNSNGLTQDVFVVKLAPDGTRLWSRNFGSTSDQWATGIALDSSQNVIVSGYYLDAINFGCSNMTSNGGKDAFVAKLDGSNGTCIWSKSYGGDCDQRALGITMTTNDQFAITGDCICGIFNVDCGASLPDLLVAGLDSLGVQRWAMRFGDESKAKLGRAIAADSTGNVYVTGQFSGTLDLGIPPLMMSPVGNDAFLAKFDGTNGSVQWARGFQGTGEQMGYGIAASTNAMGMVDHVFITGRMDGSISFNGKTLNAGATSDIFVLGYDLSGNPQCGVNYDNFALSTPTSSLAAAPGGDLILGANFQNTTDLGCMQSTMSLGATDTLIARIKP